MRNFAQTFLPATVRRAKGVPLLRNRSLPSLLSLATLAALALVVTSCSGKDPQDTLNTVGDVAIKQQNLFWSIFAWAALVFVVVEGLLVFTLWRFRRRSENDMPEQTHGNTKLEIAWTIAPTLVLISVMIPTITTIFDLAKPRDVALRVKVIGHQWWWEFQYPDLGITTANELHIPVGESISLELESKDVIHSFWVPKLAGKQDVIPGRTNPLWIKASGPGTYLGQCAELCGIQHAQMRFIVNVQNRGQFDEWVRQQRSPATAPGEPAQTRGSQIAVQRCAACHTIQGLAGAAGKVGPDLTHVGGRTTLASGILPNTPENLARWLRDPHAVKRGVLMPNLQLPQDEIDALVAYLQSLR